MKLGTAHIARRPLAPSVPARTSPKGKLDEVKELWNEAPIWYKSAALGLPAYAASSAGPGTLLHEYGHKLAIDTLFTDAKATVSFKPFGGGATKWQASPLTAIGEKLGMERSRGIVSMAGPAVDIFSSMAAFAVGHKIRHKHPNAGAALMGYAAFRVGNDVIYALSQPKPGHDFHNMSQFLGIPRWVSAVAMASVLPLEYLVLTALENHSQPPKA